MIKIERVDNLIICTNEDDGISFHCTLVMHEVRRLAKVLGITPSQTEKLYVNMLEYRVLYLKEAKLFRVRSTKKQVLEPLSIVALPTDPEDDINSMIVQAEKAIDKNFAETVGPINSK